MVKSWQPQIAQMAQIFWSVSFLLLRALVPLCPWWCALDGNEPLHLNVHGITYLICYLGNFADEVLAKLLNFIQNVGDFGVKEDV